jgi:hypothetical protein
VLFDRARWLHFGRDLQRFDVRRMRRQPAAVLRRNDVQRYRGVRRLDVPDFLRRRYAIVLRGFRVYERHHLHQWNVSGLRDGLRALLPIRVQRRRRVLDAAIELDERDVCAVRPLR